MRSTGNWSTAEIEDHIYEAAVVPDFWPSVLQQLSDTVTAKGAFIFGSTDMGDRSLVSPGIVENFETFVSEGWHLRNTRNERGWQRGLATLPRFVTEFDYYDGEDYLRDPTYVGYFYKNGLGWSAGTVFHVANGDSLTLSFEKAYARGPIPKEGLAVLDGMRPHLGRSIMLGSRLAFERARSSVATLEAIGIPSVAVDAGGRVILANSTFASLSDYWTTRFGGVLAFHDRRASALFHQAVQTEERQGVVRSFAVFGRNPGTKAIANVIPLRRTALDIFSASVAVCVLTLPRKQFKAQSQLLLQTLFDLTVAEAKIAEMMASGYSSPKIATELGRSIHTVQTQVKRLMAKTGCGDRAELVSTLVGLLRHEAV